MFEKEESTSLMSPDDIRALEDRKNNRLCYKDQETQHHYQVKVNMWIMLQCMLVAISVLLLPRAHKSDAYFFYRHSGLAWCCMIILIAVFIVCLFARRAACSAPMNKCLFAAFTFALVWDSCWGYAAVGDA